MGRHAESPCRDRRPTPLKISVSLSYNIYEPLTYHSPAGGSELKVGMRVLVPLGNRIVSGWVLDLESSFKGRLKNIVGFIEDPFCPGEEFLAFARQSAVAYFSSVGAVLDHALPASKKNLKKLCLELDGKVLKIDEFSPKQLEKMAAATVLRFFFKAKEVPQAEPGEPAAGAALPQNRLLLDPGRGRDYQEISQTYWTAAKASCCWSPTTPAPVTGKRFGRNWTSTTQKHVRPPEKPFGRNTNKEKAACFAEVCRQLYCR
jgi:primosomal protein N'